MRRLLHGLVPTLPDATATAIVARAEGVPLYAVEMVRMLLSNGQLRLGDGVLEPAGDLGKLADLAVPETLTALIAARLDALAPPDRALVLDAAVLGQSFSLGTRRGLRPAESELEPRLRSLIRRELLTHVVDVRSPERGHYAFVQALIREVAYRTLAKGDRGRYLAVARWLESLGDPELVAAVAGYLAAVTLARPGEEADELAVRARVAPGRRATALRSAPRPGEGVLRGGARPHDRPADRAVLLMLAGENSRQPSSRPRTRTSPGPSSSVAHSATGRRSRGLSRSTRVCCSGPLGSTMRLLSSSPRSPSSPTSRPILPSCRCATSTRAWCTSPGRPSVRSSSRRRSSTLPSRPTSRRSSPAR